MPTGWWATPPGSADWCEIHNQNKTLSAQLANLDSLLPPGCHLPGRRAWRRPLHRQGRVVHHAVRLHRRPRRLPRAVHAAEMLGAEEGQGETKKMHMHHTLLPISMALVNKIIWLPNIPL